MAVIATFKQQCPSCEAMISVKETMIGRKVECTKCKDKFIAEKPEEDEELEVDEDDEVPVKGKNKKSNGKLAPAGKRPKLEVDEDEDERPSKSKSRRDEDEDEDEDEEPGAKKKPKSGGSSNKLVIGLGLAGVGVLILVVAAYFIMRPPSGTNPRGPGFKGQGGEQTKNDDDKPPPKPIPVKPPEPVAVGLNPAEHARLSNLLPGDTEHVFHAYLKDVFAAGGTLRTAVWETPGGLNDAELRKRLGFSVLAVDDLICAEKYGAAGWKYAILHSKDVIDEAELKKALKLESGGPAIDGQTYFKLSKPNPALDQLARFSIGIPNFYRYFDRADRPTYVYLQNPQTLIIGDATPVTALLKAKGQFPLQSSRAPTAPEPKTSNPPENKTPPPPGNETPPTSGTTDDNPLQPKGRPMPGKSTGSLPNSHQGEFVLLAQETQPPIKDGQPDPKDPPTKEPVPAPTPREEMYLTIKPSLKAMLDRMETKSTDKDVVLFSSATDMDANRIDGKDVGVNDGVMRMPRQFWDVTLMLYEAKPRIRFLGTALVQREHLKYQLKNEMTCAQEIDAREFKQQLMDRTSAQISKFLFQLVKHEVKLPSAAEKKETPDVPPPPPGQDPEKKSEKKELAFSQMTVNQDSNSVEFILDLLLDNPTLTHASNIASLTAAILRVEIESSAGTSPRHVLAGAGRTVGEKGLPDRQVERGSFPPGAFPRSNARLFTDKEPRNRVSWMAALLPYMGQQTLYSKMRFDQSWRDPSNWLAGQTVVPQFLDPMYPDFTRQVSVNGLPVDFGATHYVGIAGIGLDAATYKRGDPATQHKRGVFSYDGAATMADVLAGRGTSNTILMIQAPHDRGSGPTPWIAGGGATLRGVPEKNSIEPFVLGKNRENKTITYQGKKGTFVLMTDGSVRFIDENIKDEVFKAMCTVEGPAPADFDLKKNPNTVLVPAPDAKEIPSTKEVDPKKSTEPASKKQESPPTKNEAPKGTVEDKDKLQGVWIGKSAEVDGKPVPEAVKGFRYTFKGDSLIINGPSDEQQGTYTLDSAKSPKHLDFTLPPDKRTSICIYELNGDELRICGRHLQSKAGRPTSFATKGDPDLVLMVFQRQR